MRAEVENTILRLAGCIKVSLGALYARNDKENDLLLQTCRRAACWEFMAVALQLQCVELTRR